MTKLLLFLVIILTPIQVIARPGSRRFIQITTQDGLSQNRVRSIYQDDIGYMWFGTSDGLNRYDGQEFKIYYAKEDEESSIINSYINQIAKKNEDEFWICTGSGISIYNKTTDNFKSFPHLKHTNVDACVDDGNGHVWFGTTHGLFVYNYINDSFKHFVNSDNPHSISDNRIRCLFKDSNDNIWIGTQKGLNLYVPEINGFFRYLPSNDENAISGEDIWAITEDSYGRLWVGIALVGLDLFINHRDKPEVGKFKQVLSGSVNRLHATSRNLLIIGKGGGQGLVVLDLSSIYNEDGLYYREYVHEPENSGSLSDNTVSSIFEDRVGDVWIGTFGGGLSFFSYLNKQFSNFSVNSVPEKSISSNLVNCFLEDGNYIWIGTEMGLDKYNKSTGHIQNFPRPTSSAVKPGGWSVYALYKDRKGYIWVGTWGEGLHRYSPSDGSFISFSPDGKPGSINSPNVFSILEDSKGRLWIGTIGGGLNKYDPLTGKFSNYTHNTEDPQTIINNSVNHIYETKDGTLYLTVYDGLQIFYPEEERFEQFIHDPDNPQTISGGHKLSIFEDSRDNLWIATNTGLNLFNRDSRTFTRYTTKEGLPNNSIQGVIEDDKGNLWISTNKGIAKFINGIHLPEKPDFRIYNRNDGLPTNDFTLRSLMKDNEGFLYFGSSLGFTMFHPEKISENHLPPSVIISDFKLITSNLNTGSPFKIAANINSIEKVELDHNQNSFTISFAALNYLNPSKNQYKFKLEGYESNWREAGSSRAATYTNINPGKYIFMVMASNNDGVWNPVPKTLAINIAAPWWETYTARLFFLLAIIASIFLIIKLRVRFYVNQKKTLELKVKERTSELSMANKKLENQQEEIKAQNDELSVHRHHLEEQIKKRTIELEEAKIKAETSDRLKSAFLANMSHEIRTPMNAIVGFSSLLVNNLIEEEEEKNKYIDIINTNSETLLVLINDILDISMIEADQIKLFKETIKVKDILEELEKTFALSNSKKIEIKFTQADHKDLQLVCDPVRFRQIMTNLISNAYKYTDTGYVHFGYKTEGNFAQFFVSDTGVGINPDEFENIFNHFYKIEKHNNIVYRGTGIGLSISRKLIEMMGGKIWVNSVTGKGSDFFFTLPLTTSQNN
jgi:signal transduction histidine kinase/ligand-binding sensor domain-containing protein